MNQAAAIEMIASFIRWVLTAAGAVEAAKSDSFVMQAAGVTNTVVCALWGQWKHYTTHKEEPPAGIPPTPPPPLKSVIILFSLCGVMFGSGCASGIFTTKNLAALANEAAYQGAKLEIERDQSSRISFEAGDEALKGLISAKDYSPDHFASAIRALKIDELKSKEASIAVSSVVIIWSAYAPDITALDEEKKVLPIIVAVEAGLARALRETEIPKP